MNSAPGKKSTRLGPSSPAEWGGLFAVGAFLAFAGAYGTEDAPQIRRIAYWTLTLAFGGGAILGTEAAIGYFRPLLRSSLWLQTTTLIAAAVPVAVVAWAVAGVLFEHELRLEALPGVYVAAVMICVVALAPIHLLRGRTNATLSEDAESKTAEPSDAAMPPAFQAKLDPPHRQATLLALQAEDHYVRLHTNLGEVLLLMRFSDALDCVGALSGARVHRSWWVATEAIESASWKRGRGELTLQTGASIPVSKQYAARLRRDGWVDRLQGD